MRRRCWRGAATRVGQGGGAHKRTLGWRGWQPATGFGRRLRTRCKLCTAIWLQGAGLEYASSCLTAALAAALLPACAAGIVTNADFDNAILRAVAGIEKKRSMLQVGWLQRSSWHAAPAAVVQSAARRVCCCLRRGERLCSRGLVMKLAPSWPLALPAGRGEDCGGAA